jgi:UDPglucose 6-dehydrogenase
VLESLHCPILPMRYESAELAKISINFCLVASVTVANTLAEVCEQIGADWSEIAPALKLDRRIGQFSYLTPGLGISGGNLERDLRTVLTIGGARGTDVGVVEAWLQNSQHRKDWTWRTVRDGVLASKPDAVIAVLGLAYKENTHSTKNSPSLQLLAQLQGRTVRVHDPIVPASVVPFATGCADAMQCVHGADAVVLATPWPQYRNLSLDGLATAMRGRVIVDPYRLLDGDRARALGFTHYTLGRAALAPV